MNGFGWSIVVLRKTNYYYLLFRVFECWKIDERMNDRWEPKAIKAFSKIHFFKKIINWIIIRNAWYLGLLEVVSAIFQFKIPRFILSAASEKLIRTDNFYKRNSALYYQYYIMRRKEMLLFLLLCIVKKIKWKSVL